MKKWLVASLISLSSIPAWSTVLYSVGGNYSYDTNTNIVVGGGLQWLRWDTTIGKTIDWALNGGTQSIEGGNWRLATNSEMATLLNDFNFGKTFSSDENTSQYVETGYEPGVEIGSDITFIRMFGDTTTPVGGGTTGCNVCSDDSIRPAAALFGNDLDADGLYNLITVADDYSILGSEYPGTITWTKDYYGRFNAVQGGVGIALVRDVASVPLPSASTLFVSGIVGLIMSGKRRAV